MNFGALSIGTIAILINLIASNEGYFQVFSRFSIGVGLAAKIRRDRLNRAY